MNSWADSMAPLPSGRCVSVAASRLSPPHRRLERPALQPGEGDSVVVGEVWRESGPGAYRGFRWGVPRAAHVAPRDLEAVGQLTRAVERDQRAGDRCQEVGVEIGSFPRQASAGTRSWKAR